jgi:pSer/pThr/pTyr-binding forkhead associated (FHA) protein
MNAIFSLYGLSAKVRDLRIHLFPLIVGRSRDADISVNDRWVSRRHCVIEESNGRLLVRDLGSKHGTFVNEGQITESFLLPGDKLHVGLTTIVAAYDLPSAGKPSPKGSLALERKPVGPLY